VRLLDVSAAPFAQPIFNPFKRMKNLLIAAWGALCIAAAAQTPQAPEIAAKSYLLLDLTAGQVLAAKGQDELVEPASLTKLMTAYLVFDALRARKVDLKQALPVSERAWKMPGSRMFIDPKMQVSVEDLLKGMIVQSGNDATVALAEGVGGTVEHFVEMMNAQAQALGMKSTSYRNPEGLTAPGHRTTASDLGLLATRLMRDFPEYIGLYAIKHYRYPGTPAANDNNRNLLLFRDPTVDGLKTGYTDAAGYCMVATAHREYPNLVVAGAAAGTAAALGSRRLLSVVLGADSEATRATESQKLLNWGYTAYTAVKLFDAGQAVVTPTVWKGAQSSVKVGAFQALVVAVASGSAGGITTQVLRTDPLLAPLANGQAVATLRVLQGDKVVREMPLVALEAVPQAGFLSRTWDAVRLWIR
jgi:D-alanyl-D-alanine carboxypeptidase (penicillin-binding protein 5/6)